jgi:hypothetical protein
MKNNWFLGFVNFCFLSLCLVACAEEAAKPIAQPSILPTYTKTDTTVRVLPDQTTKRQDSLRLVPVGNPPDSVAFKKAGIWGYRYNKAEFMFDVRDFVLGNRTRDADIRTWQATNKGQHIHINFNNSIHLHTNDRNTTVKIPDGTYTMAAFLVRSYYESVKQPQAAIFQTIEIRNNTAYKSSAYKNVDIFYGVPMGDYSLKKSAGILLDFYVANTRLETKGNQVRLTINANPPIFIDKWQAYLIYGLNVGTQSIELVLVDRQGKVVNQAVRKTFRVLE